MRKLSAIITEIQNVRADISRGAKALPGLSPSREEALNLHFMPGEEVIDAGTGEKLTVIAGTRKNIAVSTSGSSGR